MQSAFAFHQRISPQSADMQKQPVFPGIEQLRQHFTVYLQFFRIGGVHLSDFDECILNLADSVHQRQAQQGIAQIQDVSAVGDELYPLQLLFQLKEAFLQGLNMAPGRYSIEQFVVYARQVVLEIAVEGQKLVQFVYFIECFFSCLFVIIEVGHMRPGQQVGFSFRQRFYLPVKIGQLIESAVEIYLSESVLSAFFCAIRGTCSTDALTLSFLPL